MRLITCVVVLLGCAQAFADARIDERARQSYIEGRAAYERGDYTVAHERFKESFQLSHEPALLYNIASSLQGLRRPHEAAEALRSYLRLAPTDPDRPQIESRIATLEEEQHLLDLELPKATPQVSPPPPPRTIVVTRRSSPEEERKHRRKVLAVSLTIGGVVLVGGAIALGLALGLRSTAPCRADVGCVPGTN